MAEGEYELIPRKEILELKEQIEMLKEHKNIDNSVPNDLSNRDLYYAITKLQESINSLITIFKNAKAEMSKEDDTGKHIEKKLGPILSKIDELSDQNKKIAKGIIALSDLFNDQIPNTIFV